jgi:hypothetical protein
MFHPTPHKNSAMVFNGDARVNMCDGWNKKFFNLVGQPIRLYGV